MYAEFDEVIILTHVHRMSNIEEQKDATDIEYNNRATQYWDIMHRLRDYNMTLEDYYWLCKKKAIQTLLIRAYILSRRAHPDGLATHHGKESGSKL